MEVGLKPVQVTENKRYFEGLTFLKMR